MRVQSVMFRRSVFRTREQCKTWLVARGFRHYTSRATLNYWRWRQFPPEPGATYRTMRAARGVVFVLEISQPARRRR
ncbi:MAG: hypothetical protein KGL39_43850 [Patescibacteria group bacterium]|nr:hypothetical protein [Patescibacteria group bacterium]